MNIIQGLVRNVDDLGRIVIPKEYRQKLGIKIGQPMEILIMNGFIIMGKIDESEVEE